MNTGAHAKPNRRPARDTRTGAALIVAIALLVIIGAIAIAFFATSNTELQISTSVANAARADMIADAGVAIAIGFLNHDAIIHSTYTSLDFAAFSYFDGSWAAGKSWAFPPDPNAGNTQRSWIQQIRNGEQPRLTPRIPVALPNTNADLAGAFDPEVPSGLPALTGETSHQLYIPRAQEGAIDTAFNFASAPNVNPFAGALAPATNPFVVNPDPASDDPRLRYRKSIIHLWADVDNTGDGLRDSVWIPIPADRFFGVQDLDNDRNITDIEGARDVDGDGRYLAGTDILADGIDNNLNNDPPNFITGSINTNFEDNGEPIDDNLDGAPNNGFDGIDEVGETAEFIYYGGGDGLDNDGDGLVDEEDERVRGGQPVFFVTVPLPDVNPNVRGDVDFGDTLTDIRDALPSDARRALPESVLNSEDAADFTSSEPFLLVDSIDNDHDFIVNPVFLLAFDGTEIVQDANDAGVAPLDLIAQRDPRVKSMRRISPAYLTDDIFLFVKSEPVTEIIGRVAVHVRDTASQANLNAIGGHRVVEDSRDPALDDKFPGDLVRALNLGVAPHEQVASTLHQVGAPIGEAMWANLLGKPEALLTDDIETIALNISGSDAIDMHRPGYGGVDDNGNALYLAMDGIDNDGDGLVDEGLNPAYPELLGQLEGIDEPGETRHFRPFRNRLAELDGFDNDQDGVVDEIGELGDRNLRGEEQIRSVILAADTSPTAEIAAGNLRDFNGLNQGALTIFSTDKNDRIRARTDRPNVFSIQDLPVDDNVYTAPPGERTTTGVKLDYNAALAGQIREALIQDWGYRPTRFTRRFEDGFRLEPRQLLSQNAVDAAVGSTKLFAQGWRVQGVNFWFNQVNFNNITDPANPFPFEGSDIARRDPIEPFPAPMRLEADGELQAAQLAVNTKDFSDPNHAQSTVTTIAKDHWWSTSLFAPQRAFALPDAELRPPRDITHKTAGIESIRINEIMVRPVRRVEAEMIGPAGDVFNTYDTEPGTPGGQGPVFNSFDPNRFSWLPTNPNTGGPIDPAVTVSDFDMRQNFMGELDSGLSDVRDVLVAGQWESPWAYFDTTPPFPRTFYDTDVDNDFITPDRTDFFFGGSSALETTEDVTTVNGTPNVPNAVLFEFRPGPGLPPGRYYLTFNHQRDTRVPNSNTIVPAGLTDPFRNKLNEVVVLTKYVRTSGDQQMPSGVLTGTTSILQDLVDEVVDPSVDLSPFRAELFLNQRPEDEQGWVFAATRDERLLPGAPEFIDGYGQNTAFTVEIPPYSSEDYRLQVAIYTTNTDNVPLAINFFDFSQEPDHEWVEIVNVAEYDPTLSFDEQAIDLTNWKLDIGVEGTDTFRRLEIPEGQNDEPVKIAPGGMLLLAANKFDQYNELTQFGPSIPPGAPIGNFLQPGISNIAQFRRNGIALVPYRQNPFQNFSDFNYDIRNGVAKNAPISPIESNIISVPHIPPVNPFNGLPISGSSVFWRTEPTDLIDYNGNSIFDTGVDLDGDGAVDTPLPDNAAGIFGVTSTPADGSTFGAQTAPQTKDYDRIVELRPADRSELTGNTSGPGEVAQLVLDGGVFPNYPERDGVDNDADVAVLATDGVDNKGDGLVDGIDADADGIIDFISEDLDGDGNLDVHEDVNNNDTLDPGEDIDGDGRLDVMPDLDGDGLPDFPNEDFNFNGRLDPAEGVDEGRWAPRPTDFDGSVPARWFERPGSYDTFRNFSAFDNLFGTVGDRTLTASGSIPFGIDLDLSGGSLDSDEFIKFSFQPSPEAAPEWKAYAERRWFGADAVYVTLRNDRGEQVDQVSYTEQDVINRAINDGIECPWQRAVDLDGTSVAGEGTIEFIGAPGSAGLSVEFNPTVPSLVPRIEEFWPEDTMGIDFYRSLERKHPLYAGDLHGTQNRWQATDGAYDDWDAGLKPLQATNARWVDVAGINSEPQTLLMAHQFDASPLRMNYWQRQVEEPVAEANFDTALDINGDNRFTLGDLNGGGGYLNLDAVFFAVGNRIDTTPPAPDPFDVLGQDDAVFLDLFNNRFPTRAELDILRPYSQQRLWTLRQHGKIRNLTLASTGELATMPMLTINRHMYSVDAMTTQTDPAINEKFDGITGVLLGESTPNLPNDQFDTAPNRIEADIPDPFGYASGDPKDLTALMASASLASQTLTVSQADFHPITPSAAFEGAQTTARMNLAIADPNTPTPSLPPDPLLAWTPVFLFPNPEENAGDPVKFHTVATLDVLLNFPKNYLFNDIITIPGRDRILGDAAAYGAHIAARWPLRNRVAFYVSQNSKQQFDATPATRTSMSPNNAPTSLDIDERPAEALFMWDADDGLENGEYDVLLVVNQDITRLQDIIRLQDPNDPIINPFVAQAVLDNPTNIAVDVEVFTDRNADRRVWLPGLGTSVGPLDYPIQQNLNRGQLTQSRGIPSESFGLVPGLVPDANGVVRYGVVRVQNNTLAVFLRNFSRDGAMPIFSRVILTPRERQPGRVNINTAQLTVGDVREVADENDLDPTVEAFLNPSVDATQFDNQEYSPLLGVPGILASITSPVDGTQPYPAATDGTGPGTDVDENRTHPFFARDLLRRINFARNSLEWVDGRYFRHPSDLLALDQVVDWENEFGNRTFTNIRDWNTGFLAGDLVRNVGSWDAVLDTLAGAPSDPDGIAAYRQGFNESVFRFSRMANMITTRSDTFEIFVTAQPGYVFDANGDGILDIKNEFVENRDVGLQGEFVVQGEKKMRVVYER